VTQSLKFSNWLQQR